MFEDLVNVTVPTEKIAKDRLLNSPLQSCEMEWLAYEFWNLSVEAQEWSPVKAKISILFSTWQFHEGIQKGYLTFSEEYFYPTLKLLQKAGLL